MTKLAATTLTAKGSRELKNWEEKTYSEVQEGAKLANSTAFNSFHGDIEGEAKLEYLLIYFADGSASFTGLEQVTGKIGSRSGSFVLRHEGKFENMTADVTFSVVPRSGSGDLNGLLGEGHFVTKGHTADYTFDYYFE